MLSPFPPRHSNMKKDGYFAGPAEIYAYSCHIQQPIRIVRAQPASQQLGIEILQPRPRERPESSMPNIEAADVDVSSPDILTLFHYQGLYWRLYPLRLDDGQEGQGEQPFRPLPAVLYISPDEANACGEEVRTARESDDEGEEEGGDRERYHPRSRPSSYAGFSHSQFSSRTEGRRLLGGVLPTMPRDVKTKHEWLFF